MLYDQLCGLCFINEVLYDQLCGLCFINEVLYDQLCGLCFINEALYDQLCGLCFTLDYEPSDHTARAYKSCVLRPRTVFH